MATRLEAISIRLEAIGAIAVGFSCSVSGVGCNAPRYGFALKHKHLAEMAKWTGLNEAHLAKRRQEGNALILEKSSSF